jgi:DNA-directed RNA polymerase subunit L
MKFSVLKLTKEELELELDTRDPTITELLSERLNENDSVEVAAPKWEHPLVANPKIYIRVNKGDPLKVVKNVIDELKKELVKLKDEVK